MLLNLRRLLLSLIILPGLFLSTSTSLGNHVEDEIRIDVPADGRVRVENRFGDVRAEIWDKPFVSVSAVVTSPKPSSLTRSPIVIDNRGKYLAISTLRIPANAIATIDLKIKVPQTANLEISTIKGKIALTGLSASALLKSISGDIEASINEPIDVNLTARSARGVITSSFPSKPATDDHLWQVRLGSGSTRRSIDAQSETGRIAFAPIAAPEVVSERPTRPPELVGATNVRPIGTPAEPDRPAEVDEGDVIRVDSQLVTLNTSVVDRSTSRGVKDLRQNEFRIFEDGEEQNILQLDSS